MKSSGCISLVASLLISSAASLAQQEAGDIEVGVFGTYSMSTRIANYKQSKGNVAVTYGMFVTDDLEIAIAPTYTFWIVSGTNYFLNWDYDPSTGFWDIPTTGHETYFSSGSTFDASLYLTYSFLAHDAKMVPYVGGTFFINPQEGFSKMMGICSGLKYFISRKTALDLKGNYLFSLERDVPRGMLDVTFGIAFLF